MLKNCIIVQNTNDTGIASNLKFAAAPLMLASVAKY